MLKFSPLTLRRFKNFRSNKRGMYSSYIFLFLFLISLFANFLANDKPLIVSYDNNLFFPILEKIPETFFGGEFETEADYKDPFVRSLINSNGFFLMPPIEYYYDTINYELEVPSPSPPTLENLLGTDDQGRDVLARLIYGFRISVFFGLILTFFSTIIGVIIGGVQGYFGGKVDLFGQRFIEIWSGPVSYTHLTLPTILLV